MSDSGPNPSTATARGLRPRGRKRAILGGNPGLVSGVRKPVKSIGRHAAQHYDPQTGRKIQKS